MNPRKRLDRIWLWYKRRPSTRLREVLVEHYWKLLCGEARRFHRRLPASVDVDDLIADGALGLLDAIDRFDPTRAQFQTFGRAKIRSAILDGLRERDPISRSTRKAMRDMEAASDRIRATTGVNPTPQELAEHLHVPLTTYMRRAAEARRANTCSLSGGRGDEDHPTSQIAPDALPDKRQSDPSRIALRNAIRETLVNGFSPAERLVTILYYYEELTMKEIGHTLDLSESRVSQMHTSILARLKSRFDQTQLGE